MCYSMSLFNDRSPLTLAHLVVRLAYALMWNERFTYFVQPARYAEDDAATK